MGIKSAFLAASITLISMLNAHAETYQWRTTKTSVEQDGATFSVSYYSMKDKNPETFEGMLAELKEPIPAAVLIGDFTEVEEWRIKKILDTATTFTKATVQLELVIIKTQSGYVSASRHDSSESLMDVIREYHGKEYKSTGHYGKKAARLAGDQLTIPTTERELAEALAKLRTNDRSIDGYDFIFLSHHGQSCDRIFAHELAHLLEGEAPLTYEQRERINTTRKRDLKREGFFGFFMGREITAYHEQRDSEIDGWIKEQLKTLEDPAHAQRVAEGARYGKEWPAKAYENMLETAALRWRVNEPIADAVADILMKDGYVKDNKKNYEECTHTILEEHFAKVK